MRGVQTILILVAALFAVFLEAAWDTPRLWTGAQPYLLPPLMVYAALQTNLGTLVSVAVVGGIWTDTLSANPLGASVLPLFGVGALLQRWRDLILRDLPYAQFVLGAASSVLATLGTLVVLLTVGERPLVGWGTVWQLAVVALAGGVATPACFWALGVMTRWLAYQPAHPPSFRADREIKRGRH